MRPIDFVVFDGGSTPNEPVIAVAEVMTKDIKVFGADGEYEVLSYYFHNGTMVLDVQKKQRMAHDSAHKEDSRQGEGYILGD